MTTKEFILEQLSATRNTKAWFVSIGDAVKGLTAEQAKWRDVNVDHSVWQIVNHLTFWNERWLIRTRGDVPPKMEGENSGTFSGDLGGEAEWQSAVKKLDDVLAEFEARLKGMDDEALKKEAFEGYGGSWYDMFAQMTIHTAYHIGQIVYVRKQQGSWNSQQGVS